jgi:hypothetical protein
MKIARLGGYMARARDPAAGNTVMWRGLAHLTGLTLGAALSSELVGMCARTHPAVAWVGCWAHARRRFFEGQADRPRVAKAALRLIGRLYQLEAEWDHATVGDARAALRQEHFALPIKRLRQPALALHIQLARTLFVFRLLT